MWFGGGLGWFEVFWGGLGVSMDPNECIFRGTSISFSKKLVVV